MNYSNATDALPMELRMSGRCFEFGLTGAICLDLFRNNVVRPVIIVSVITATPTARLYTDIEH